MESKYYLVESAGGNRLTARTASGAHTVAEMWRSRGWLGVTITIVYPDMERRGRNIAHGLALAAVWALLSEQQGDFWLSDRLREAGLKGPAF